MNTLAERLVLARKQKSIRDNVEFTQQDLATKAGVSQGSIGHLESGRTSTSRKITAIAKALDVDPEWLANGFGSPRKEDPEKREIIERGADRRQTSVILSRITAIHPDDAPQDDVVFVPESKIAFSAGNGCVARYELVEDQEPASYRLSWFQKYGINPERARRFRVSGDSMEPMLFDRDTILVNTDETAVVDGKMYAIRYGDELRVKYLIRRLDGTLILRSVNPLYKEEEVAPKLAEEHIAVLGRVRDRSGTGGL